MLEGEELLFIRGRKMDFFIKVITEVGEFLFQVCHRPFYDPDLWSEFVSYEVSRSFVTVFSGISMI